MATRLVHATNETAALDRFAESIARVHTILPNCEIAVLSSAEIAFRWRGLEFARARLSTDFSRPPTTFSSPVSNPSHYSQEFVFGVGAEERVLDHRNWTLFEQLVRALRDARHPYGPRGDRLFRLHPER